MKVLPNEIARAKQANWLSYRVHFDSHITCDSQGSLKCGVVNCATS